MAAQAYAIRLSVFDMAFVAGLFLLFVGAWWIDHALKTYKKDAWLLEY